jgi:16S rRNA processing protein RimM
VTQRRFSDLVAIGRVVKPQGRKGEVAVEAFSDRPDRFPSLRRAYVRGAEDAARPVEVAWCWPHKGRFVLKLAGVDSIDEAERLRGAEIGIGEEELPSLPAGSYYHHQLKGLPVEDATGQELGTVTDILETGAGAGVLVVRGPAGEVMVPLTDEFVRSVDLTEGRIVVVVPEFVDAER